MTTWGRRRGVAAAVVLAAVVGALTGCTETADETRTLQGRLGRIDGVGRVEVTSPSWEQGAAIAITYEDAGDPKALAALIGDVDDVAADQGVTPYRLTLTPDGAGGHALSVDDTFRASAGEQATLGAWFAVTAAMIGPVDYDAEDGWEWIGVDSGGGIAHDVGAARELGYGGATTRWTFRDGDTTFVVGGAVSATDVTLLADVQSEVGSAGLPVPAAGWRLGRYAGHVRLDVDVAIDEATTPARLTAKTYGARVEPLATAALDALRTTGLRRFLSLQQAPTDDEDRADVFATWTSTQPPAPGRDRLGRGWDPWLERVASA
ncbi:hypothetical protein [Nocardioides mangrovi]|uniref:Uncharacterized protein n=1 Tax=Nocardioides mangrovi TaxID=2874580 RepID=A0ABS7UAQ2_9ACTN|nr:hypothetical protein [Nocardioides mangrovi]MBZ5738083.1 hypothetical protein [Nocardioides mangrovi]